ncbi:MAG: response regulator transcription factor [Candidatus Didemnitutus sp.]|nr:response regulator transcription factor [Candidatus Didemnitutus sp.]
MTMKVLIADDHEVVRRGIKDLLTEQFGEVEFGEAGDGGEALALALGGNWDLLLLDINMPGRGGLDVLVDVKKAQPRLPVLVLSMARESEYATRVLKAGASGFLTKQSVGHELAAAVDKVLAGGRYVSAALADQLAAELSTGGAGQPHEKLSDREFEVMKRLATGRSVKEIAGELSLSEKTVFTYRARLLEKLKLQGDVDIARYALKHGLVE